MQNSRSIVLLKQSSKVSKKIRQDPIFQRKQEEVDVKMLYNYMVLVGY
jgi:hypothetical protein